MYKSLISSAVATAFVLSAGARTVDLPVVDAQTETNIIRSVELTDTATRFNMSMFKLPGKTMAIDTLMIKGRVTKKVYNLLRSEGYVPGTSVELGESGRYDYVYVFPALDPSDTMVDMRDKKPSVRMTDMKKGIHLGLTLPGKYKAYLHGRHEGKSGFVAVTEAAPRDQWVQRWIPVDSGYYSATFTTDKPMFYMLVDGKQFLKHGFKYAYFFPDGGDVEADFFFTPGDDIESVTVKSTTSPLTQDISDYTKTIMDFCFNSDALKLRDSEAVRNFKVNVLPLKETKEAKKIQNLAGLFALTKSAWSCKDISNHLKVYREVFRGMYPDHPYSKMFEELDQTYGPIPGNPYCDFTAPDFKGQEHRLSDLINGRPALIDLWGSSCGPCRANSKKMIPVYNEFASKGFTVVGVAREYGGPEFGIRAIEKDGYPWVNLLELDDKGGIWGLYRIQSSMGGTFLVGADGKIVAVKPTPEEVRAYLLKVLPSSTGEGTPGGE